MVFASGVPHVFPDLHKGTFRNWIVWVSPVCRIGGNDNMFYSPQMYSYLFWNDRISSSTTDHRNASGSDFQRSSDIEIKSNLQNVICDSKYRPVFRTKNNLEYIKFTRNLDVLFGKTWKEEVYLACQ